MSSMNLWQDRSSPKSMFRDMWNVLDDLDRGLLPRVQGDRGERLMSVACDVSETENAFFVSLDVPGLKKEEIQIEVKGHQLTVSGERQREEEISNGNVHRIERSYGKFFRLFELPEATNTEEIEASYDHGVLKITVPKTEDAKARKIQIGDAAKGFIKRLTNKVEAKVGNA